MSDPAWLPHGELIGRAIQRRGMTRKQRLACVAAQAAKATTARIRQALAGAVIRARLKEMGDE